MVQKYKMLSDDNIFKHFCPTFRKSIMVTLVQNNSHKVMTTKIWLPWWYRFFSVRVLGSIVSFVYTEKMCSCHKDFLVYISHIYTEKNSLYPCTRNQIFCLVWTGANFAILVEMTKFKFSKKTKKAGWFDGQILSGACIKHNQKTTLRLWSTRAKFILIKVGLKE